MQCIYWHTSQKHYSWKNFHTVCFWHTTYFYLIQNFSKNKWRSGTSLPASFSGWFLKENISFVIFCYLADFRCLVAFTSIDIGQYVCCNCLSGCIVINFEMKLIFLIKSLFQEKNSIRKFKYLENKTSF